MLLTSSCSWRSRSASTLQPPGMNMPVSYLGCRMMVTRSPPVPPASPTATEDGLVYVVKAGRTYEELAVNDMKEIVMTTPAISDGSLFIRTRTHLYALGEKEQE